MDLNSNATRPPASEIEDGSTQANPRASKRRMISRSRSPELVAASSSIFGGGPIEKGDSATGTTGGTQAEKMPDELIPEKTVDRLFGERVVTIRVGSRKTIWRLHENLLSSTSEFFRAAFNGGFMEASSDVLDLPEDDPQAFELFVRWLYARAMNPPETTTTPNTSVNSRVTTPPFFNQLFPSTTPPPIQDLLRLYVLASKLMIEELENSCTDTASWYFRVGTLGQRRPDIRDVQYIYLNTPAGSGMQRLLRERLTLGLFRGKQHNPVTAEWRDILNQTPDLGFDIVNDIAGFHWVSGSNAPGRVVSGDCVFHRHEKGEVCRSAAG